METAEASGCLQLERTPEFSSPSRYYHRALFCARQNGLVLIRLIILVTHTGKGHAIISFISTYLRTLVNCIVPKKKWLKAPLTLDALSPTLRFYDVTRLLPQRRKSFGTQTKQAFRCNTQRLRSNDSSKANTTCSSLITGKKKKRRFQNLALAVLCRKKRSVGKRAKEVPKAVSATGNMLPVGGRRKPMLRQSNEGRRVGEKRNSCHH